jgi:3-dehydroquinate dehydratase
MSESSQAPNHAHHAHAKHESKSQLKNSHQPVRSSRGIVVPHKHPIPSSSRGIPASHIGSEDKSGSSEYEHDETGLYYEDPILAKLKGDPADTRIRPNLNLKVKEDAQELEEAEMDADFDALNLTTKRRKIQQKNCIDWLKKRYRKTTKLQYLYYPEELLKKGDLKRIFLNFDADETNTLDMHEFIDMFVDNYIVDVYSTHQSSLLQKKNQHQDVLGVNLPENDLLMNEIKSAILPIHLNKLDNVDPDQFISFATHAYSKLPLDPTKEELNKWDRIASNDVQLTQSDAVSQIIDFLEKKLLDDDGKINKCPHVAVMLKKYDIQYIITERNFNPLGKRKKSQVSQRQKKQIEQMLSKHFHHLYSTVTSNHA